MSVFRREVHTASIVKPTPVKHDGATKLDYASPVSTRTLKGFLSTRGGTMSPVIHRPYNFRGVPLIALAVEAKMTLISNP